MAIIALLMLLAWGGAHHDSRICTAGDLHIAAAHCKRGQAPEYSPWRD